MCVFCASCSWHNSSRSGQRRGLHQRQLHQHASEWWELHVHRLSGSVTHHSVWLLANGLGAEVQRDRHDDPGSRGRESEMSAVLASDAEDSRDGGRQVADHAAQGPVSWQLCHPTNWGQRCPGWFIRWFYSHVVDNKSCKTHTDKCFSLLRPMKCSSLLIWTTRGGRTTGHPHNLSSCSHLFPTWGTFIDLGQ